MRKTRVNQVAADYDSSSDFSDFDPPALDPNRYQRADMQRGLATRQYRLSALRELHAVVVQGYSSAPKKLQAAMFEDLLVAVRQSDSRPAVSAAVLQLVAAVKRVLPQQKRHQIMKEQRQAAVAANRAASRHAGAAAADEDEDADVVLGDIPQEVVCGILHALDPASLARAACVCRAWRELATGDELWQQHLQSVFPAAAQQWQCCCTHKQKQQHRGMVPDLPGPDCSSGHGSSWGAGQVMYRQFAAAAARNPAAVLPWLSCRVLAGGQLEWMAPGSTKDRTAAAVKAARRGVITADPIYVTTAQAVRWLLGCCWTSVFTADIDSSSSSSDDDSGSDPSDGEESHTYGRKMAAKALRLWAINS